MPSKRQSSRAPHRRLRPAPRRARVGPGPLPVPDERFLLRLYVTGVTPASRRAVENARAFCEQHLEGRYDLEVYDIYQMPALAKDRPDHRGPHAHQGPPAPLRRFVGDLSRSEKVLFGLDLREKP